MTSDKKTDACKLDHATLEATRLPAIEATKAGMKATDLAPAYCVHRRTVFRWLADYYKSSKQALKAKPIPGCPPKLDEPQMQSLAHAVTDQTPLQHDQMIDLRHPLAVLSSRIPWQEIKASVAHLFAGRVRSGKTMVDVDLFGSTASLVGTGVSKAGRPRLPLRLRISLLYALNESDEGVVERWAETSTWQYLSGLEYFNTAGRATRRRSASSAACWVRKASRNCLPRRSTSWSCSSSSPRRTWRR